MEVRKELCGVPSPTFMWVLGIKFRSLAFHRCFTYRIISRTQILLRRQPAQVKDRIRKQLPQIGWLHEDTMLCSTYTTVYVPVWCIS